MHSFIEDQDTLSPEHYLEQIALENIDTGKIASLLSSFLPKTTDIVKELVPALSSFMATRSDQDVTYLNRDRQKSIRKASDYSFSAYSDMLITVPENFDGKLIPYFKLLLDQGKEIADEGKKIVMDFNVELSRYLSDNDIRSSMKSNEVYYRNVMAKREGYTKALKVFFKAKDSSRAKLGSCIDRFADLEELFHLEFKLHTSKKQQDFKNILIEVNKCVDLMTLIQKRITQGEFTNMSAQAAKNISKGSYEVAKYVEYLANYGYMVEVALGTTKNLCDQFKSVFK